MARWFPVAALIVLFAGFQIAAVEIDAWPLNFQPLLALAFCAMAMLKGRQSWVVVVAWLVAWPVLSALRGYGFTEGLLSTAVGFGCVFAVGHFFRRFLSIWAMLGGVTLGALSFYLVTNTFSFFELVTLYPRTLEGFVQAQWTGPNGFGPTWVFLRNSVTGSLFFTALFSLSQSNLSEPADPEEEATDEEETEAA